MAPKRGLLRIQSSGAIRQSKFSTVSFDSSLTRAVDRTTAAAMRINLLSDAANVYQ